jgi:cephalosporin-C deacetylase-like acetyl esterase
VLIGKENRTINLIFQKILFNKTRLLFKIILSKNMNISLTNQCFRTIGFSISDILPVKNPFQPINTNFRFHLFQTKSSVMKTFSKFILSLLFAGCTLNTSIAQNIVLKQSNESGIYKKGEQILVTVFLNEMKTDSIILKIRENYSEKISYSKIKYTGDSMPIFSGKFEKPTSLIFEVTAGNKSASTGLVVDAEHFQPGTKRPKDFDKYWENEIRELKNLPVRIKSFPVTIAEAGYSCADIEINCTGPKPARGYFAKPEKALPKSLPIVLFVRAAGVKGDWCQSKPQEALNFAKMGNGALAFDLNAHGMLNGQPQQYYDELEKGELRNYWEIGNENRDEYYFRGMYLRLIRTLDFLTSQPEWDGKRILVIGESQGGGQALAAAGLDERVSAVVATVPAMCDFGGELAGRTGGWPQPFKSNGDTEKMLKTIPYFDVAHLLKNSKATIVTEIGFIDSTCPSVSIYAAINQSKGEKIVFGVPYRGHHLDQKEYQKIWEETVYKPKMKFIEEFLKK